MRSARGSADCRSRTSWTVTSTSSRTYGLTAYGASLCEKSPENVRQRARVLVECVPRWGQDCPVYTGREVTRLYHVGDKVVYPHHGAGTVVKKEERPEGDSTREYLTIQILHNDMTV